MDSVGLSLFFSIFFSHVFLSYGILKQKVKSPLFIGLNPALQRTITINGLQLGAVNRASNVKVGIGGKGQNAVVAAKCMQSINKPTLLQFLGQGFEGDAVARMLETITDKQLSIRTNGRCRVCVTLLDTEATTEIIEPSEEITLSEIQSILDQVESHYHNEKPSGIAIMGSMPKPCPTTLYSSILSFVCNSETKVLLDTVTGLSDCIKVCFQNSSPCVVKLNANELCSITGTIYAKDVATSPKVIYEASTKLMQQIEKYLIETNNLATFPPILALAITDGPFPAHLLSLQNNFNNKLSQYVLNVPILNKPLISPIGAGDATSSGTLMHWCGEINNNNNTNNLNNDDNGIETSLLKSFRWGLACGSASCMSSSNSVFELNDVLEINRKIEITKI